MADSPQRVALVTGGGGALGRAIGGRLARDGLALAVLDNREAAAADAAAEINSAGGQARAFVADIADYQAVAHAVAEVEAALGPVDVLVNNAGWDHLAPFVETTPELWDRLIAVNLRGPLNLHHRVVPGMIARGRGKIVNIASDAGRVGSSGEAVYAACKGGLIAFSKTLARELARPRICVNVVCPGPMDTPLLRSLAAQGDEAEKLIAALERAIPFRRLGQPDDVAGIVAFLASAEADFITGQVVSVSGGLTMHG